MASSAAGGTTPSGRRQCPEILVPCGTSHRGSVRRACSGRPGSSAAGAGTAAPGHASQRHDAPGDGLVRCVLRADRAGLAVCWGDGAFGKTSVPGDLPAQAQCGERRERLQRVWYLRCGDRSMLGAERFRGRGCRRAGPGTRRPDGTLAGVRVTASYGISCWVSQTQGPNNPGPVPSGLPPVQQFSIGLPTSCVVLTGSKARCWGAGAGSARTSEARCRRGSFAVACRRS